MMQALIPVWILGAPFVGLVILLFSFRGSSAMGGDLPRPSPRPLRGSSSPPDASAPLMQPMHPDAMRRKP